jgi:hypothetical protein
MNRNVLRIVLDIVMVTLLVLMYRARMFGLDFHETGGLIACGLFIIHNGVNRKWITGVSARLFSRKLPAKTRIGYAVDVSLLATMAAIAVSGIMISRTVLVGISGDAAFWRPLHYFSSALALVLVGVHVGLHWSFIRSMFSRLVRAPRAVVRPLGAVCLAGVLLLGSYSIATSSFVDWLAAPFADDTGYSPGQGQGQGQGRHGGGGDSDGGALGLMATYGSAIAVFAAGTALLEKSVRSRNRTVLSLQPA